MYDAALANWCRVETEAHADGARDRIEVLWLNAKAIAAKRAADAQLCWLPS
jgi:DNA adenine methylase